MPKYIDANLIEYETHERIGLGIDYGCDEPSFYEIAYKQQIDAIPAADVRENTTTFNETADYPSLFTCGRCKWSCFDTYCGDTATYNYCPNCGRKIIDLEEKYD